MAETLVRLSGDVSPDLLCIVFGDTSPDWTHKNGWTYLDMLFIYVCVYNTCVMAKNNTSWIRLRHVSQTATVRREKATARTTRPRVADDSFDGVSTFQPRGSHLSSSRSRLSQTSHAIEHEVSKAFVDL